MAIVSARGRHLLKQRKKKWLVLACGWAFVLLGVVGLFLPILQGVLFLLIGLVILSTQYVWARNILTKVTARFPKLAGYLNQARQKARSWMHRAGTDSQS